MTTLPIRMKFRVESPEHSEAIQRALFHMGCVWDFHEDREIRHTDDRFLLVEQRFIDGCGDTYNHLHSYVACSLVKGQIVEGDHGPWDGFIPWFGNSSPVSKRTTVEAIIRGESEPVDSDAEFLNWDSSDIIAYRVVKEALKEQSESVTDLVKRLQAENEALRNRLEVDPRHSYDGIDCRDTEIRFLEAELKKYREQDRLDAQRWKQMAEYQYALRTYPHDLEMGIGALDATMRRGWSWDAAIAAKGKE